MSNEQTPGTQTGSLVNHVLSGNTTIQPVIGMGATVLGWSDRHPATIVEISKSGKRIGIQEDNYTRTDKNGMSDSQTYEYSPNTDALVVYYTLRKNGAWVREGQGFKNGTRIAIGRRERYYDFSF